MELEYWTTDGGIKYAVVEDLEELEKLGTLSDYDRTVAEAHRCNYRGLIFVGEFHDVLDNEYDLDEVSSHYARMHGNPQMFQNLGW